MHIAKSKSFSGLLYDDNKHKVFSHFPRSSVCFIIVEYLVRKYKQPKSSHFYFMIIVYTCISDLVYYVKSSWNANYLIYTAFFTIVVFAYECTVVLISVLRNSISSIKYLGKFVRFSLCKSLDFMSYFSLCKSFLNYQPKLLVKKGGKLPGLFLIQPFFTWRGTFLTGCTVQFWACPIFLDFLPSMSNRDFLS